MNDELRTLKKIARVLYHRMRALEEKIEWISSDLDEIKGSLSSMQGEIEDIQMTIEENQQGQQTQEVVVIKSRDPKELEAWNPGKGRRKTNGRAKSS